VNFGRVYCDFLVYIFYSSIFWDTRRWIKSKSTIRSKPIISLKMYSLFTFMLKSPNIYIWNNGNWSNTCSTFSQMVSFLSQLLSLVQTCTFRTSHQYNILSITIFLLTADLFPLCMKKNIPKLWLSGPFQWDNV